MAFKPYCFNCRGWHWPSEKCTDQRNAVIEECAISRILVPTERQRTEKEMRENCLARVVTGACCQYPDCDCFQASDYYEQHPEELAE